jgi:hypothetical protein
MKFRKYTIILSCLGFSVTAWASDPIWHCSRQALDQDEPVTTTMVSQSSKIEIAPLDLFEIYSGGTVLLGSKPLAACYVDRNSALTTQAMSMLDINPSSLDSLRMNDSIVQSKIYSVRNAEQMKACITQNHPALGYLNETVEDDSIGPCF